MVDLVSAAHGMQGCLLRISSGLQTAMQPDIICVQQVNAAASVVHLVLIAARAPRHAGSAHLLKAETAWQGGKMTGQSRCGGLDCCCKQQVTRQGMTEVFDSRNPTKREY